MMFGQDKSTGQARVSNRDMNNAYAKHEATRLSAVGVSAGLKLVPAKLLAEQFTDWGMTDILFLRFLKALGVSTIVMPDGTHMVDFHAFVICLKAFALPSSDPKYYCPLWDESKPLPREWTALIPDTKILRPCHIAHVLSHLLAASKINMTRLTTSFRSSITHAYKRMLDLDAGKKARDEYRRRKLSETAKMPPENPAEETAEAQRLIDEAAFSEGFSLDHINPLQWNEPPPPLEET